MATNTLHPNSDFWTQWLTTGSNHWSVVNDTVILANDFGFITATDIAQADEFDLDDSMIVDGDTVTKVEVKFRYRSNGFNAVNSIEIDWLIGGVIQGTTPQLSLVDDGNWHNLTANDSGWDSDWTASELDGARVIIRSFQSGKPFSVDFDVSAIEVVITYSPGGGATSISTSGDLFIEGLDNINSSVDLFIHGFDTSQVSGNLFISGHDIIAISGDLFISGKDTITKSDDLFIGGHDSITTSGDLFIYGLNTIQASGDLFINGHESIATSGDLFIGGIDNVSASVDLFIQDVDNVSTSGNLFIPGLDISSVSGDLFIHGLDSIEISGDLFINGEVSVSVVVCPPLDATASIQIKPALIAIYQSRIDALINQLGKNVRLIFDPILTPCPNCFYDTLRKRSNGIYMPGGPRPFKRGRKCPYCKGRGLNETSVEKCIKCLLQWNPTDAENYGISVSSHKDIVRFKTYLTNFNDLVGAKTAISNYDVRDTITLRVKRITEPILVGLRESRYCISFWELL